MGRYALRRLLGIFPVLLVVFTLSFLLMRLAPGGPFDAEKPVPPEVKRNLELKYHLREPACEARFLPALAEARTPSAEKALRAESPWASRAERVCTGAYQYGWLLANYVQGDFGPSYKYKDRSVNEFIASGLPVTIQLGLLAMCFALLIGLCAGLLAAMRHNAWEDHAAMGMALLGISIPNFVLGPILIMVFSLSLLWLPPARWEGIEYMLLPAFTLGSAYAAYIARLTRGGMLEVIRQDYIRTARAKGLTERTVVVRHGFRNAMIPLATVVAFDIGALLGGAVITETVFEWNAMGRMFIEGLRNLDPNPVMAFFVVIALFAIVFNLLADITYAVLDPRIRIGE